MTAPDPGDTESSSARTDAREAEMLWPEAAAAAFEKFTEELDHRAKQIEDTDDVDPVHDMRTGTPSASNGGPDLSVGVPESGTRPSRA